MLYEVPPTLQGHEGLPVKTQTPAPRPSKAETHDRILGSAIALFSERGYDRTSMRAIAGRAGVSHSAIFWHFGDKETLFRESVRSMLLPFFEEFKSSIEQTDPRERVFGSFAAYERVVAENGETIRSIVRWLLESEQLRASLIQSLFYLHNQFVQEVRDTLEEAQGDDPDSAALAAAIVSLLDGNLLLAMLDPSAQNRALREEGLRILTRRALGRKPARNDG
jgi:AcrR family transcriptional regulator